MVEEPQGDRYVGVYKHASLAASMLSSRGVRFVEASYGSYKGTKMPLLLISDPKFWLENEAEIIEWLSEVNIKCHLNGMLLEFDNNEDKMMFMLRWS